MLSVDTPEVTARTAQRAAEIDQQFQRLAEWLRKGIAPISQGLGGFLLRSWRPVGRAGSLHFKQGRAASVFGKTSPLASPGRVVLRVHCTFGWPTARSMTIIGCWPT